MKNRRNGKIDLLKYLFAMSIAVYHFDSHMEYKNGCFKNAYIAVEFFFIVSGYFMAKSLSKYDSRQNINVIQESLKYIKHKYFGFFKYHVFAFIMTVIAWKPVLNYSYKKWAVEIIKSVPNFFLLRMFDSVGSPWLMVEWYLSSMMIVMFILSPIIIKYRKTYSCYIAPVLSLFLICFVFNKCHRLDPFESDHIILYCNLRAFAEISLGCILFEITKHKILEKFPKWLLVISELACYLVVFAYITHDYTAKIELTILMFMVFGIAISLTPKAELKILNNKAVYFLGKLSLSVYLCHTVIYKTIVRFPPLQNRSYLYVLAIYFVSVMAVSCICMFTSEQAAKFLTKEIQKSLETNKT